MKLGKSHVSALLGWAGEKGALFQHPELADGFSILN
jgi:hypothetical protein